MTEAALGRRPWAGRLALELVAIALTAVAFVALSRVGVVGDLPVAVLLILLALAGITTDVGRRALRHNPSSLVLNGAIGAQVLSVTAIIYSIGWGATLCVGYVFVAIRALHDSGARVWRLTLYWTVGGLALGQSAIALGVVPTFLPSPYVYGLAALAALGMATVMWLLGTTMEQREHALADRERSDRELRSIVSLLTATLESTADGILVVDSDGAITRYNARFAEMWRLPESVLESGDDRAAIEFVSAQLKRPETFVAQIDALYENPELESEDTLEFVDGRVFERRSRPQRVDNITVGRVWSFHDATHRTRLLDELARQVFYDSLTGLANRALLRDRLEHALARSRRSGGTVTVLFCDLDRFKLINDSLGHSTGDVLLVEVAGRFENHIRDGDTVARLGGDEFAFVLDETPPHLATALAHRLLDELRVPFVVDGREISVRGSIGIADNEVDACDADELLARADIAMYAAKFQGRDRVATFERSMQLELTTRHELENDLRLAVQHGELALYFQPILALRTRTIESFEALVRWDHPTRGQIGPDRFIRAAEDAGLILGIGRYVLREACRQAAEWLARPGASHLAVSVNVSSHQLHSGHFVADVEAALHDTGLLPTNLILEVTESSLLADVAVVHERLDALKRVGIRIAIDDFGTGFSSLAYLREFPVDFLKIDRAFVEGLDRELDGQGRALVRSIIGIGHSLSLGVVAEGIERPGELEELIDAGCDTGQGFLFSPPVPADEFSDLLTEFLARTREPVLEA